MLKTLRFLATGSFLQGLHKSTVSRVVRILARKLNQFVKFPESREVKNRVKQGFYEHAGFPCVIGCVDRTHVRIFSPTESEPDYVNRKGYHSINVQGICDHRGIISINIMKWQKRYFPYILNWYFLSEKYRFAYHPDPKARKY